MLGWAPHLGEVGRKYQATSDLTVWSTDVYFPFGLIYRTLLHYVPLRYVANQ